MRRIAVIDRKDAGAGQALLHRAEPRERPPLMLASWGHLTISRRQFRVPAALRIAGRVADRFFAPSNSALAGGQCAAKRVDTHGALANLLQKVMVEGVDEGGSSA